MSAQLILHFFNCSACVHIHTCMQKYYRECDWAYYSQVDYIAFSSESNSHQLLLWAKHVDLMHLN